MIPCIPSGRRLALAGFALLLAVAARAADGSDPSVPAGWFVWPAVEPADGSAFDVSALNAARGADLPRIRVEGGHFVTPDGKRLRFWGANVAGADAYPATEADAVALARHLAKGGVNIVRLHHLDNPWGVGKGGSIWPDGKIHRELDPTQLDRLHRFIAALRDQGIYSNLNLKVSKQLSPEDGFDASVADIPNFDKRVDIFDRRMIELQKDYARRLLTTKNPYTGFAPANDPAVAVVEINNENSLLGYWTRDLGRNLEKFPAPFVAELRGQWNVWLAHHYADDAALAESWRPATPAGRDAATLIPASSAWSAKIDPDSAATIASSEPSALEIRVSTAAGVDWHVQVGLHGLAIDDGGVYTVEFLAKADHPRQLGVGVGLDGEARPQEEWRSFGLLESVDVGPDWTPVRLVFPAHSVAGAPAALNLNAGQATGTIVIKDLKLVRDCAGAGLQAGQSAAAGSVPLPLAPSARQWADWIHFLADTERAFAEELRDYLKNDLHVQAAIVCSQIDYGGLTGMNRETSMDFADGHAYWQHPQFTGGASWDPEHWVIRNTAQLDALGPRSFGELGNLALVRVAGKPFTVSEYDHPAPSEFACEMYPEIASFAARQDWDIIYPFCIGADGAANPDGKIVDFFDQLHQPVKWMQSPFAALVLRRGLVPAAARAVRTLHLGSPVWAEQPHADVLWHKLIPDGPLDFLDVRYAVSDQPGAAGAKAALTTDSADADAPSPVRIESAAQGKVYVIDTPQASAATGYLGGGTVSAGALRVTCERFGRDFASVAAVALDDRPLRESHRVLVTVVSRATNQGIVWNDAHNSVGAHWGHGPTIAEHVPATVTLAGPADREVYALAPDGSRARRLTAKFAEGALTFAVSPGAHTIGYEIVTR